jgi:hypothetical protein
VKWDRARALKMNEEAKTDKKTEQIDYRSIKTTCYNVSLSWTYGIMEETANRFIQVQHITIIWERFLFDIGIVHTL